MFLFETWGYDYVPGCRMDATNKPVGYIIIYIQTQDPRPESESNA